MTTTEELLSKIEQGGSLDGLAAELGMRKSVLVAMIEFLVRKGYLSEIRSGEGQRYAGCSMCGTCSVPARNGWVKMNMLTGKGKECVKKEGKKEVNT